MDFQKLPIKRISMALALLMTLSMFAACKSKKINRREALDKVIKLPDEKPLILS